LGNEPGSLAPLLDALKPLIMKIGKTDAIDQTMKLLMPLIGAGGPLSNFPGDIGDLVQGLSGVLALDQAEGILTIATLSSSSMN
jgi:hypothetical protein